MIGFRGVVCLILMLLGLKLAAADVTHQEAESGESTLSMELQAGVELDSGVVVEFPPPLRLASESDAALKQLEKIASRHGWKRFSWNSVNAPLLIKVQSVKNGDGDTIGHEVHSAFIAYAPLGKLRDEQIMEATFGKVDQEAKKESTTLIKLESEELEKLGLTPNADEHESYARIAFPILKKVVVEGIIQMQGQDTEKSVMLAWKLAADIDSAPATWVGIKPNSVGTLVRSDPKPYRGLAGYMAVSQTGLEENQLLIESHLVIHEPTDWFSGSKLLRSKLSTLMQENARSMRRKLRKLDE